MSEAVITVTERALKQALQVRSEEPDAEKLALFLEAQESGMEWAYDLYFDDRDNVRDGDAIVDQDGLTVVVPADSIDKVKGSTLDLSKNLLNPGWVVDNPNSPSPAVGKQIPAEELTGTTEEKVQQVLDMVINPSIAAHGGQANLDRVEDGVAYLQLSGGCQGCGLAKVTLSQGIEVALKDAIPEITGVEDVTDHEAGENPYFAGSKK